MIIFKGAPGKTLLDIAYSSKSVQMWNAVLTAMREKLEPKEVRSMFSLTGNQRISLHVCVENI